MSKNIEDMYPLSPLQQGILFHALYAPEAGMYVEHMHYTLHGALQVAAFERAWQGVVEQHAILRTAFLWEDLDAPLQIVHRQIELPFERQDWRGLSPEAQHARLQACLETTRHRGFVLSQAPLMRLFLCQVADEAYEFLWSVHHLLLDAWSVSLLFQDLLTLYKAYCQGAQPSLERRRPYRDYIAWLHQQDLSQAEAFWRQTLAGCTAPTPMGMDRTLPQGVGQAGEYATQHLHLSLATTEALQACAQRHRLTLNTLVQGAWAILLSRYSDQNDVVFGAVVSGRPAALVGAEAIVGMFINTLPVRVRVSSQMTVLAWLQELQAQQVQARLYEYSPLVKVQGWSDVPRGLPLFETLVVFESQSRGTRAPQQDTSLDIRSSGYYASKTGYPLTLIVDPRSELLVSTYYDARRFDGAMMARMLEHFQAILESLVARPGQRVADVPLLSTAERQQVLVEWNATTTDYPREQGIHEVFEAQVARTPDAIAVVYAEQQLTYRALNQRATHLAQHLRTLGVGPEVLVGFCVERSLALVIGLLGILKAGGAYVPLDPTYPPERLAFMVADAQVGVLVTQPQVMASLPACGVPVCCLDGAWDSGPPAPIDLPSRGATADTLAYVMYTSGSTGQPKGTSITHRSVVRLVQATNYVTLSPDEVLLQCAPLAFDASTFELWGSLLNGARLVLFPAQTPDLAELGATLQRHQVSTLWLTAGLFHLMVEERLDDLRPVRQLLAGGDVLSVSHVQQVGARWAGCQVINGYGPTENTTFTCCYPVPQGHPLGASLPIGRPIANTQVYVLDQHLQPVPVGVVGELYVGGDGLARDYLRRPALTAERFLPHPYSPVPGARLYKTGDLVRYTCAGDLEFLGRRDQQVKLRGFRIEPGEIGAVLSQHPAVRDVVTVVREDKPGEKRLVAYVVPDPAQRPTGRELRHFVQQKLPEYMVPAAVVLLDTLPLTPNGKVDRQALPAPERTPSAVTTPVAPRTPIEEVLAGIWAQVFSLDQVDRHDDFFDLGGHSLLATQVVSRLREAFQVELPLRTLFEAPTLAALATRLETMLRAGPVWQAPPGERVARHGALPLSFAQQRLWFLDQVEPDNPAYNIASAVRLTGRLNVAALEQSLNSIIQRHESLRTTFATVDGQPLQRITPTLSLSLPVVDLSACPAAAREAYAQQLVTAAAIRPFTLAAGPLFRACLLRLDEQEHIVLFTMHHIISDEWSLGVLVREVAALYEAFCHGQPSPLPELPLQYADFAHWQRQWLQGEVLEDQLAYWRQRLGGNLPVLELPFDRPRPAVPTYRGALHPFVLPAELSAALIALSRQEGCTVFMTLLAALQSLLQRYTGQDDVVVGTDVANRNQLETEGLIGFFVNHLVLRTDLSGNPTFRDVLKRVREVTLGAYTHQDLPFDMLVGALRPERQLHHTPLFQVLFVFGNPTLPRLELPGLRLQSLRSDLVLAKYDLTLFMGAGEQGLGGTWRYSTDVFTPATIRRMSEHFLTLLGSIVANPDSRLNRLEMLTAVEQQHQVIAQRERQEARAKQLRSSRRKTVDLSPSLEG